MYNDNHSEMRVIIIAQSRHNYCQPSDCRLYYFQCRLLKESDSVTGNIAHRSPGNDTSAIIQAADVALSAWIDGVTIQAGTLQLLMRTMYTECSLPTQLLASFCWPCHCALRPYSVWIIFSRLMAWECGGEVWRWRNGRGPGLARRPALPRQYRGGRCEGSGVCQLLVARRHFSLPVCLPQQNCSQNRCKYPGFGHQGHPGCRCHLHLRRALARLLHGR